MRCKLLTSAQQRLLNSIFDDDPSLLLWPDVVREDGRGRNPTFRVLVKRELVTYTHVYGNSFRAILTIKGIHLLHGEDE